jgi:hypothetical protein
VSSKLAPQFALPERCRLPWQTTEAFKRAAALLNRDVPLNLPKTVRSSFEASERTEERLKLLEIFPFMLSLSKHS